MTCSLSEVSEDRLTTGLVILARIIARDIIERELSELKSVMESQETVVLK